MMIIVITISITIITIWYTCSLYTQDLCALHMDSVIPGMYQQWIVPQKGQSHVAIERHSKNISKHTEY